MLSNDEANLFRFRIVRKKLFLYHVEENDNFFFPRIQKSDWSYVDMFANKWSAKRRIKKLKNPKPGKVVHREK